MSDLVRDDIIFLLAMRIDGENFKQGLERIQDSATVRAIIRADRRASNTNRRRRRASAPQDRPAITEPNEDDAPPVATMEPPAEAVVWLDGLSVASTGKAFVDTINFLRMGIRVITWRRK